MLGVWSIGYWLISRFLKLSTQVSASLGYPVGLALIGLLTLGLWQAGVSFSWLYWLSLFFGTISIGMFSLPGKSFNEWINIKQALLKLNEIWKKSSIWEVLLLGLILATLCLIAGWLLLVQPVVWDSLVLYDWRALRIAGNWSLLRLFGEFTQHPEFYNYDFSHPFMSSIWQAFLHKSGIQTTGIIYLGLIISALAYARIIVKNRAIWLIASALLLLTMPMLTVATQVYSALPFIWFWILIMLVILDESLSFKSRQILILIFLVITMLNRVEAPFWLVFSIWLFGFEVWKSKNRILTIKAMTLFMVAALAVFVSWHSLQQEAASYVQLENLASRSSYELSHYASVYQIISQPSWWWQSAWLITGLNPIFPYALLAGLLSLYPQKWSSKEKWLWGLMIAWLAMLYLAVIFEVSTSPELWREKARLLSRVSLPLVAISIAIIIERLRKHWWR
jgi:hypothetical protein